METPSANVPRHVAVVMDGNGRWASRRFLPRIAGHQQGVEALKRVVRACAQHGVRVLTVFAFSSENWKRPAEEVSGLMDILVLALRREVPQLQKDQVQLHFSGNREGLSERLRQGLEQAQAQTADNQGLVLNVCFNYGGRWDVAQAARALARAGTEITEHSLAQSLSTARWGDPDLIIRTGGEMRLSNFLLWQAAYSELFFSDLLWPDFDEAALAQALAAFAGRERRFGQTAPPAPGASGA